MSKKHFEFELKESQLHVRVSTSLLAAIKRTAKQRGIPYTRFVRKALEQVIQDDKPVR